MVTTHDGLTSQEYATLVMILTKHESNYGSNPYRINGWQISPNGEQITVDFDESEYDDDDNIYWKSHSNHATFDRCMLNQPADAVDQYTSILQDQEWLKKYGKNPNAKIIVSKKRALEVMEKSNIDHALDDTIKQLRSEISDLEYGQRNWQSAFDSTTKNVAKLPQLLRNAKLAKPIISATQSIKYKPIDSYFSSVHP